MDAMKEVAVLVQNGRGDILGANRLGQALYSEVLDSSSHPSPNFGRFIFLNPRSHDFYLDWDDVAQQTVAILRAEAGRSPRDRALSSLVGELSTQSEEFRALWAAHDVREHRTGVKSIRHPVVGDLTLSFEGLQVTSAPGLLMLPYTAEPGSESHEKLQLLAHWAAADAAEREAPGAERPAARSTM